MVGQSRGALRRWGSFIYTAALPLLVLQAASATAQTFPLNQTALGVGPGNTVQSGATFVYRINYRCNSTTTSCQGVQVSDTLPAGIQFVSAQGTSDVASIDTSMLPTVRFVFNASVPAGNTGDLDITVRFANGSTPNGTMANNQPSAMGTNIPPSSGPSVTVTATSSFQANFSKSISGGQAFLDMPTTYNVAVQPGPGNGSLNLTGVTVIDTLPAGVSFVSASDGGTYDPMTNLVTWNNGGSGFSVNVGSSLNLTVTVTFDTPTFADGQMVTNTISGEADPLGLPPNQPLGPVGLTHEVEQFVEAPSAATSKGFGGGHVAAAIGQTFLYDIRFRNSGNVPLDTLTGVDTIPPEIDVLSVSTGSYGAGYTGTVSIVFVTNTGANDGPLGSSPGNTNATFNIPALDAGEWVTGISWTFAGPIPVGMNANTLARVQATLLATDNNGMAVAVNDQVSNCVDVTCTATTMNMASCDDTDTCFNFNVSGPYSLSSPSKSENGGPYLPGQNVHFEFDVDNQSQAFNPLSPPTVVDLLPKFVTYTPGSFTYADNGTGVPAPSFTEILDYAGTGRTLLRWVFSAPIPVGASVGIEFDGTVQQGAIAGTLSNTMGVTEDDPAVLMRCNATSAADVFDLDGDSNTAETLCQDNESFIIGAVAQLESEKLVLGQCDTDYSKFPDYGATVRGGTVDYRFRVRNIGTVPTADFIVVDILPAIGDTGVLDLSDRDSGWTPILAEPITPPPGATLYYSTATNPCRGEVAGPTASCNPPNWSTVPPTPITAVRSFKIDFGGLILNPLDVLAFDIRMIAPADAPLAIDPMNPVSGEIAWNSFAFRTERLDGGTLNAEPLKVGIIVKEQPPGTSSLGDYVWIDLNGDGIQNDGPTGVNDVPVRLIDPSGDAIVGTGDDVVLSTSITQDDINGNPGWYEFSGLDPGNYAVCFTPPINYAVTLQDQGGDDELDSDADPFLICTPITQLGPDEHNPTLDLGLLAPTTASLGNYVWFDRNGNGQQDEAATDGVNGVVVRLFVDSDNDGTPEPNAADGPPVAVTGTANDGGDLPGYYVFSDLIPGVKYFVQFVLPASATGFTTRNSGADVTDSDANTGNGTSHIVMLMAGDHDPTIDAGLVAQNGTLRLGDLVWCDSNFDMNNDPTDNNGLFDALAGEVGVDGVVLSLYRDGNANSLPDVSEFFAATVTATASGEPGRYLFDNLPAGDYIVVVNASNFQSGGPLEQCNTPSTNAMAVPDPDANINNDNNGDQVGVLILSAPITLAAGSEPVTDGDDADGNLTLDFGFTEGTQAEFDYGDAPDGGSGSAHGDYRTTALDGGAYHAQTNGQPWLGNCVDSDSGTAQSASANADDATPQFDNSFGDCSTGDDEDGVVFTNPLVRGSNASFTVTEGSNNATCSLNAWVDWNQDGDFTDAGEQIATNVALAPGASTNLTPLVPASAAPGLTYARFRCATAAGVGPVGPAADGEVEDYLVRIPGTDLGDAPDTYQTLIASGGPSHDFDPTQTLYLGHCIDHEADGQPGATATGDDLGFGSGAVGPCADDEDGVTFDTMLMQCQTANLTVTASAAGRLNAWLDFNFDGDFNDAGEQIFDDQALVPGANALMINVPCGAAIARTYARFRFDTTGGLGVGGTASDGEVEDYRVSIKGTDFGDAPSTYTTGSASHTVDPATPLYLGLCEDGEQTATVAAMFGNPSSGDDTTAGLATVGSCAVANDDEDGVTFNAMLVACDTVGVTVRASQSGRLFGWIDFNRDGDFDEPAERVANNVAVVTGNNNLNVTVPCGASPGVSYARFRVTTATTLTAIAAATDGEVEDYDVVIKHRDFGDAPDSYGTTTSANGARHVQDPTASPLFLGACLDTETDGAAGASAIGDDGAAGTTTRGTCAVANDDEDGVSLGMLVACGSTPVTVTANAAGRLDGWIDFNRDGDFDNPAERVLSNVVLAAGANALNVSVPCNTGVGASYARFRFSSVGSLTPTGDTMDGEVEDYPVLLKGIDFGDAPNTYGTTQASNGPRHAQDPAVNLHLGACVDTESDGVPATAPNPASGDDSAAGSSTRGNCAVANDDEDGVNLTGMFIACESTTVTVNATAAGRLDAWIDFNRDGDFDSPAELIANNVAVAAGANPISVAVPCSTGIGNTYARFRLSSSGGLAATGAAMDGEVEDYELLLKGVDYGDAPNTYATTLASNGPRHAQDPAVNLYLGSCLDTEPNGVPATAPNPANGDDTSAATSTRGNCMAANDDEDGLTFGGLFAACGSTPISVNATLVSRLDGWIDFNRDGDFDEPAERVFNNQALAAGANALNVAVPCTTGLGVSYARFRVSSGGGLTPNGIAMNGEVEDYELTLVGIDLGDAPNSYDTNVPSNGPRHSQDPAVGLYLGACVDTETNGQPANAGDPAVGDDGGVGTSTRGTCAVANDDEDGVVINGALIPCNNTSVTITATAGGRVDGWIDFNANNVFDGAELVLANVAVVPGPNALSVAVPCNAVIGPTYARFRASTTGGLGPQGSAPNGEVEDYNVRIAPVDMGDAPDTYRTILASNGPAHAQDPNQTALYLGTCLDTENDGQPSAGAAGDDGGAGNETRGTCASPNDDEDGVRFFRPLIACDSVAITIVANRPGRLDGWIDFNASGTFDAAEQFAVNTGVIAGDNVLHVAVPCSAVPGNSYMRLRLSSAGGLSPTGLALDGEIEDHAITLHIDTDQDGVPDDHEEPGDRDGDGIPNDEDFDPTGCFYDEVTGEIIPGGRISVMGPGNVELISDGSDGCYQFFVDVPGTYMITVLNFPLGWHHSLSCHLTSFDPLVLPLQMNPVSLGNGRDGNTEFLTSNACTPHYYKFTFNQGSANVINNNIPLAIDILPSPAMSEIGLGAAAAIMIMIGGLRMRRRK